MIKKKICLLGSFAVGKTSLFESYVHSQFSETYLTTIGVRIEKKLVSTAKDEAALVIWDIEGRSEFSELRNAYLLGMQGYFLVADGTREASLEEALSLREKVQSDFPACPSLLLLNKADLVEDWVLSPERILRLEADGLQVLKTSAKTGLNVELAFRLLAAKMGLE